jgi:bifunctional DNA-binding transcriptional regulator/antitoxin component of YhaV-PrlF toxin-antitoxin module
LVKLQFDNNKQYKITLPKALIDAKGWKKGAEIKIELDSQGSIILKLVEK